MLRIAGVYLGLVGEVIRFAPSPLGLLAAPVSVAFAEIRCLKRRFGDKTNGLTKTTKTGSTAHREQGKFN